MFHPTLGLFFRHIQIKLRLNVEKTIPISFIDSFPFTSHDYYLLTSETYMSHVP